MTWVSLARLRRSKAALFGLCLVIVGGGLLAWHVISESNRLPVHNAIEAALLGCSDSGHDGDGCHPYRVAGIVVAAPVRSVNGNADFEFELTDGCINFPVSYHGDAASAARLRAGGFAVAQGSTGIDGNFHSGTVFVGADAEDLRRDVLPTDPAIQREWCPGQRR